MSWSGSTSDTDVFCNFPERNPETCAGFLEELCFSPCGRVGSTTDYITQKIRYVEDTAKKEKLLECLEEVEGLTLVFVGTKRLADHLEEFLYHHNFSVVSIHGDRSQQEREAALEAFRTGQARIMVATDVAARGLDVKDVKHVINYDLPHDVNDYVHRIGRTGRCGAKGLATAFFNDKNKNIARDLVELLEESTQNVESWLYSYANPSSFSRNGRAPLGVKRGGRSGSSAGGRWGSRGRSDHGGGSSRTSLSSSAGSFHSSGNHGGLSYSGGGGSFNSSGSFHVSNGSYEGGSDNWW